MDWTSLLSLFATITSFICQFVGIEICWRIVKQGGTGDISSAPFIAFFVSNCVWLKYGFLINDTGVILSSGQGAVLQLIYICIFYKYASLTRKQADICVLLSGLVSLVAPLVYATYLEQDSQRAVQNLGLYCCFFNIVMSAAPLATLSHVIQKKSTKSLSLPLCLANLLNSLEWSLYGFVIDDPYLFVSNAFGSVLSVFQILLFYIYGCREKNVKASIMDDV